jgi:uncharacterized phage protein gp47/JayE
MPNQIDANGLQVKTFDEIVTDLSTGMKAIYGDDINLESNSPDGQKIRIFAQVLVDQLELLVSCYNSFDPDTCFGVLCDQRYAINGVQRKQGTFTYLNITILIDRPVQLPGLDDNITDVNGTGFTVADNQGNQFILAHTTNFTDAGAYTFEFRSATLGLVQIAPNTVNNIVSITLGVVAVNNPTGTMIYGIDEETDAIFRTRRQQSFYLQAVSPADALRAALLNLATVTDAQVIENNYPTPLGNMPPHSIWCIVEGGTPPEIANVIYAKRGMGVATYGGIMQYVARPDGSTLAVSFDTPTYVPLFLKFSTIGKNANESFDSNSISNQIANSMLYRLNQKATTNDIIRLVAQIEPDAILTSVGISIDGVNWQEVIAPATPQCKFVLDVTRITITQLGS